MNQGCELATGHCMPATGSGALGSSCSDFYDCASGDCVHFSGSSTGVCTQACSGSSQCPNSFLCLDFGGGGLCLNPQVYLSPPFTPGTQGVGQSCTGQASSATTSDCHSLIACSAPQGQSGVCTDTCRKDAMCGSSSWYCGTGQVTIGSTLTRETYCMMKPVPGGGESSFGSCLSCGDGGVCVNGGCAAACTGDSQCAHGFCYQPTPGFLNGYCADPCCTFVDCPGRSTCLPTLQPGNFVVQACVAEPAGATKWPDDPCNITQPSACQTDLCLPSNPLNASSTTGYCSVTCCTDADCISWVASSHCQLIDNGLRDPDGGFVGFMGACVKE